MTAMPTTKTFSPSPRHVDRRWYVVDADGAVLGRLASEVAKLLRGKHKPIFAPHVDTGDHVVVVNAKGIRLTGGKEQKKIYYRHSQYPGGLREVDYERLLAQRPAVAVEKAVRGMLPKNRLGRQMIRKLSVYEGPEHPHQAQKPEELALGAIPRWEGLPEPKPAPPPKSRRRPSGAAVAKGAGSDAKASARTRPTSKRGRGATSATKKSPATAGAKGRKARKPAPPTAGEPPSSEGEAQQSPSESDSKES
jgi:large subunit ribosomal protein L13